LGIAALMYVPFLRQVFSTAPLGWHEWAIMALFSPLLLFADEIRKFFLRRTTRKHGGKDGTVSGLAQDLT
jgi:hypothetical protein